MARLVCESDPVSKILSTWYLTGAQERKRNKLKDSFTLGLTLGVSHILVFTVPPSLPIVKLFDCPTVSFRIETYILMKDVVSTNGEPKVLAWSTHTALGKHF
jgi:hypothetical protein